MSSVDDLADFLLARAHEPGVSDVDRGKTEGLVQAWHAKFYPAQAEEALRLSGTAFATHPDYRPEWRPGKREIS